MDYRRIEDLLERYWACKTTESEETELEEFFTASDIPAHLAGYKALFTYREEERIVGLDHSFDRKILDKVEFREKAKRRRLALGMKVAAGLILLIGIAGVFRQTGLQQRTSWPTDTFRTPEEAIAEVQRTLGLVACKMNEGQTMIRENLDKTEILTKYIK